MWGGPSWSPVGRGMLTIYRRAGVYGRTTAGDHEGPPFPAPLCSLSSTATTLARLVLRTQQCCKDYPRPYGILDLGLLVALGVGRMSSNMMFKRIARGSTAGIEGQLTEDRMDVPIDGM